MAASSRSGFRVSRRLRNPRGLKSGGALSRPATIPAAHESRSHRPLRFGRGGSVWVADAGAAGSWVPGRAARSVSLGGVTTATVALEASARVRRGQTYVALAAIAWSTAGVLQRQLTLDTSTQVFGRAAFAGAALLAYVAVVDRGRVLQAFRSVGLAGVAVALCVATASGSFIAALNHTSVARVLFIMAVAPVMAALLARVTLGEPITRRTVLAMTLGAGGRRGDARSAERGQPGGRWPRVRRGARLRGDDRHHALAQRRVDGAGDLPLTGDSRPCLPPLRQSGPDRRRRRRLAGGARHRSDRARLCAPHRRRAADSGRAGGAHHAARGGARPRLGLARAG